MGLGRYTKAFQNRKRGRGICLHRDLESGLKYIDLYIHKEYARPLVQRVLHV